MTYREVLGSVAAQKIRSPGPTNEVNWKSSMHFCQTLSDAIESYGTTDLPANFVGTIEPFINSILECAVTERTQLSVQACRVTGNLAKVLAKDMHPFIDRILPVLIKHCASTKAVNQKSSAAAISNIIVHSTYSPRLLWHICEAFEEKNVGPRLQAPGWLLLILQEYPKFLTTDRDLDAIINAIHSGLVDADNNVRTKSRTLFWEYHKFDPVGAETLKGKLNTHALSALESDAGNPNKKTAKPKTKEPTRPESSLAQMRQQAKKRLQENVAASTTASAAIPTTGNGASRNMEQNKQQPQSSFPPSSITSANFVFGELELGDDAYETRDKKPAARDAGFASSQKSASTVPQADNHHISKPASRPISIHKKNTSHDSHVPPLSKKLSTMEISGQTLHKKTSTADGLRTAQTKKSSSTTTSSTAASGESHGTRSLLSGPVRRPRIVATPMNVANVAKPSSRPSSRTGHLNAAVSDPVSRGHREGPHSGLKAEVEQSAPSDPLPQLQPQPLQQIKTGRKILRQEIASPVLIPDGKENALVYPSLKSISPLTSTPTASHIQRVLDHATKTSEAAQLYIAQEDAANVATPMSMESELRNARGALSTAIGLLRAGQMDSMGFRKLKNIICNHGSELIDNQDLYNTVLDELIPRLGSVQELVYRGDPRDIRHPTYVRQTIVHMILTLLKQYHPVWSERYMGPALATMMLARCAYSRNAREFAGEQLLVGQPYIHENTTVEVIMDAMQEIVVFCPSPLDVLDSVLDYLGTAESFILEHADDLKLSTSVDSSWRKAYASWDRYSKEERLRTAHLANALMNQEPRYDPPAYINNWDGFKDTDPDFPGKLPFVMETGLKLITPLLMKARVQGHRLYPMQEALLGDLSHHLLTKYTATIRRHVMPFCEQLYLSIESEAAFWAHFPSETDRNLLHYFLADLKQKQYELNQ